MLGLHVLMLAADAAWWVVLLRLTKQKAWRTLIHVFFGTQVAAHLSLMCGLNWSRHAPQVCLVMVLAWHYLAVALAMGVLLPVGIIRFVRRRGRGPSEIGARAVLGSQQVGLEEAAPTSAVAPITHHRGCCEPGTARGPGASITHVQLTRRAFIGACAALAPPVFTFGLTGLAEANLAALRVRRFALQVPALPRGLDGITIAHLSDLHVGGLTSERVLRQMVEKTNALRPDLVLHTGDLINRQLADLPGALEMVKRIEARYGCCMIEGNHDLFENSTEFARQVRAAGIPLLVDESLVASVRGYPVQLLGLHWLRARRREIDGVMLSQVRALMPQRQPEAFPILLAHHPHAFDAAAQFDLPLTLAGHTHGGYWMLNDQTGVGSVAFRYWSGLYSRGGSHLIVSNGIGNWPGLPPARINAPAEIVHLTLRCA